MMKKIQDMSLEEIKSGYTKEKGVYHCHFCDKTFEDGEIYVMDDHFYNARKATTTHIKKEHGSVFAQLLQMDKKATTLTDLQKVLFRYLMEGKNDKEIAAMTNTTPATIRHQRFVFKEKANQAKCYLAIYELIADGREDTSCEKIQEEILLNEEVELDSEITEEEEKVLRNAFSSFEPLRLKFFPAKEKRKLMILRKIAQGLNAKQLYTEEEINAYLNQIFEDFATLRRYLIDYQLLYRTKDCRTYAVHKEMFDKK